MKLKIVTAFLLTVAFTAPTTGALMIGISDGPTVGSACRGVYDHAVFTVGDHYLAFDSIGGQTSVWIYEESNNMGGLQRADEVCDITNDGEFASDTILF